MTALLMDAAKFPQVAWNWVEATARPRTLVAGFLALVDDLNAQLAAFDADGFAAVARYREVPELSLQERKRTYLRWRLWLVP